MTLFLNHEKLEVPKREGSDAKEVFTFFGLCTYYLQVFEQGFVNLVVGLRLRGSTQLTQKDIDVLFDKEGKKTLGQLINDVRRHINISSQLEESLTQALQKRNYVVHHFFVVHDIDFMSSHGRVEMIEELRDITCNIQNLDREVESITHSLWKKLGLTEEIVKKELVKMHEEARQKDSS